MWLVLLQYLLYFGGLEPNLQYLQGMPVYDGISFSLQNEGNAAICDNMDEPERDYAT